MANLFTAVLVLMALAFGGVRLFGFTPYVVVSGSMEPDYPVGSLIYVADTPHEDIQEGDVVTFYKGSSRTVATHQVYAVDREREEFYTQGTNNRDSNGNILHDAEPVPYASVIGCPVLVVPYLGYLNRFSTSAPGICILAGTAAVLALVPAIIGRTEKKHE